MNDKNRFVLFLSLMLVWVLGWSYIAQWLGFGPEPPKPGAANKAAATAKDEKAKSATKDEKTAAKGEKAKTAAKDGKAPAKDEKAAAGGAPAKVAEKDAGTDAKDAAKPVPARPKVAVVEESELVLGSATDHSPGGYRLEARLTQKGAGVESLVSSRHDAEFDNGVDRKRPLKLIPIDRTWPASLTLTLKQSGAEAAPSAPTEPPKTSPEDGDADADADAKALASAAKDAAEDAEDWLDSVLWEVVKDEQGRVRRPVKVMDPATKAEVEGQAIVFRAKAPSGVVVTKTFRLGKNIDGLEVELAFESPDHPREVVYNLMGPHGIPIEGEWYTSTFRDLVFGQLNGETVGVVTHSAYEVAKATKDKPIDNTVQPLVFSGVENQYFATLLVPVPPPTGANARWDDRTLAIAHPIGEDLQKADVAARTTSREFTVGPDQPVTHTYRLFAGPKTTDALLPYGAEGLATYRKNQWIPFAPTLAHAVIGPTLEITYDLTARVAGLFGGRRGNYGIAIILLTALVRGLMFPLSRKQALAAKKMQDLQPQLKELQAKFKDDKEKLAREQFALYKRYGVNPVAGCVPALIQLPIFVGLWQALNTSFPLRHASFLWIHDLAAPDMLFRFPGSIPFLGDWFNLLPVVVVALMIVQTKLFSPPAASPEAEQQQKMMKYMMMFMGVMFYKVPSGLGIYFITSSLWALGERLLLPKISHAAPVLESGDEGDEGEADGPGRKAKPGPGGNGNGNGNGPRGPGGKLAGPFAKQRGAFANFWERVLEEARKDPTYRKAADERENKGRPREKGDPRARPRRR